MKRFFPLTFAALLLCGCPDTKLPKPTPMVPEPKAVGTSQYGPAGGSLETQRVTTRA